MCETPGMKLAMGCIPVSARRWLALALLSVYSVFPGVMQAAECARESYYASDDYAQAFPRSRPTPEFSERLQAAENGSAQAQRNLAISYESGYLVSRCRKKADYWYRRAAAGGDQVAQKWVAQSDARLRLMAGAECADSACVPGADDRVRSVSIAPEGGGHYFANITINGKTVRGLIDTGASKIALSTGTAVSMGIPLDGKQSVAETANGAIRTVNRIVPSVRVAGIELKNVEVAISPSISMPLIGMSFLRRLRMNTTNGQLVLSR